MTVTIEIEDVASQRVASTRATTIPAEIGATFGQKIKVVGAFLQRTGAKMAGPPYARYFNYSPEDVDMEIGAPIDGDVSGDDNVEVHDMPGGRVAAAIHLGRYEGLAETYDELATWISRHGFDREGAPWEVYIAYPGNEPEPEKWETRIYWPVRLRAA
jgi:effector-binding domain-containing protein